ncbi:hypothetical protein Glove_74g188 [Diversispora epigaea]|uniref:TLDc domain-containing protein n=1 Tax=Diversispora epigaea TaxID=1348612 RepID=A0A397JIM9_9GLOM|nr:hypothetical protein Glove_74g188 [Diversispora epigaea]
MTCNWTQNPILPSNLDEWASDNFLTLKTTLKQCLSHIRYFILSSNIITDEHTLEISSWIDKRESNYENNLYYEFKLLVRGSRDEFDVKTIYEICDKVSIVVIVLKVKDTGEILEGYIPCELDKNKNEWIYRQDRYRRCGKNCYVLARNHVKNFHSISNFIYATQGTEGKFLLLFSTLIKQTANSDDINLKMKLIIPTLQILENVQLHNFHNPPSLFSIQTNLKLYQIN